MKDKKLTILFPRIKQRRDHVNFAIPSDEPKGGGDIDLSEYVKTESLDASISAVNETISGIDTRLKDTEEMQTTVVETVEGIAAYMGEVDETLGSLDTRVKALEGATSE